MDLPNHKFTQPEEYLKFVDQYVSLVDQEMREWEERAKEEINLRELARQMPVLISLVNTVGYLRGQDGAFLDNRPPTPNNQDDLYRYEDEMEKRLVELIKKVLDSEHKGFLVERLESYLVKARSGQKPDVL